MPIQKHNESMMWLDTKAKNTWCVFEHHAVLAEGDPPQVIFVGACPLTDVYRMAPARTNSEWVNIFNNGGHVMVQIVATTQFKTEAYQHAQERVRDIKPTPVCNVRGHNLRSAPGAIICHNNQRRYDSQKDAAIDLGIHASSISRHLNGHAPSAQGFTFAYAVPNKSSEA